VAACCGASQGETRLLKPGQSIQKAIDASADGDLLVLSDGVYHEPLVISKAVTLKAQNPGEATITNRYGGAVTWKQTADGSRTWYAEGIDWPVQRMLVAGVHAFDYRTKENFDKRLCGPNWSKGWQETRKSYTAPPIYFAHDAENKRLWLQLNDARDPNRIAIDFNSAKLDGKTLVQKDLGDYWNQQEIVEISSNPPVHPVTMWYAGTPQDPKQGKIIDFPKGCGIVIDVRADKVAIEGLRLVMAPTVGVEVNNSHDVTIRDCYFAGYQFAINTGYECTRLRVANCEMDGGEMVSFGKNTDVTNHMWNHSTYVNPIKFNGTGLTFVHNYVYEGYDLFHPRGRHKDFPKVPDLRSEVSYNSWHVNVDNVFEFDAVEALMNMRVHHNIVISSHDVVAFTTTENGGPLTLDHNIFWPGGGRLMKLTDMRSNRGVQFVHNTLLTGSEVSANDFTESVFENNIVISGGKKQNWTPQALGAFFPTKYNLLKDGEKYTRDFQGLTADPMFGDTPQTIFLLQKGSPAIDAGVANKAYHQDNVADGKPDLGAVEHGQTVDDWRKEFGHCGPTWITAENAAAKAPHRPKWPKEVDPRWGGLN
jgi:hypothetical protein